MEEEEQLKRGFTAVLLMVDSLTWIAYVDQLPEINTSGSTPHEAFAKLVDRLQQRQENCNSVNTPLICAVKLVRPSLPF